MLLKRLETRTNALSNAQDQLANQQVQDEELFATHLKNLNDNFTQDLKQYAQDLRSEMIKKHIQGLRNEIQFDPTLTDLQEDVEQLGKRIDSFSAPVTNWGNTNTTTTFKSLDSSTILCDIEELKRHLKEYHCTKEIAELRKNLEQKIAKIPIRSYRDEVNALNTQLELVADQVNVHNT